MPAWWTTTTVPLPHVMLMLLAGSREFSLQSRNAELYVFAIMAILVLEFGAREHTYKRLLTEFNTCV